MKGQCYNQSVNDSLINLQLRLQVLLFSLSAFKKQKKNQKTGTWTLLKFLFLWAQLKAPNIGTLGGPFPSILLCKKNDNPISKEL